jgi:DNA anti-recombination protein RmuC
MSNDDSQQDTTMGNDDFAREMRDSLREIRVSQTNMENLQTNMQNSQTNMENMFRQFIDNQTNFDGRIQSLEVSVLAIRPCVCAGK